MSADVQWFLRRHYVVKADARAVLFRHWNAVSLALTCFLPRGKPKELASSWAGSIPAKNALEQIFALVEVHLRPLCAPLALHGDICKGGHCSKLHP